MIGSQPLSSLDDVERLRAGPAVSWGAIVAGAAAAVATSVILLTLGAGLGFASISPWANRGASAVSFAISGAIWLIVTQWLSAALGGYIAGRLRHRWLATHQHEVFFRDTAHGLVTWSVATLVVVLLAGASLSSLAGAAAKAGGAASGMALGGAPAMRGEIGSGEETMYGIDKLLRGSTPAMPSEGGPTGRTMDSHMEVMHIAAAAAASGDIAPEDRAYLASLVAAKSGISTDDAQRRVDAFMVQVKDIQARAKSAADTARKAAAQAALYTALAMLIGAFIASVSAAIGGRLRDEHL